MVDTLKGSYFSEVLPEGWDISKIYDCVSNDPSSVGERQSFWNDGFRPVECTNLEEFGAYMGHEIAMQIRLTKEEGRKLILILPVGPMGMYKWAVYFLKEWNVDCKHVYGFNMDEWADAEGNTLPASDPARQKLQEPSSALSEPHFPLSSSYWPSPCSSISSRTIRLWQLCLPAFVLQSLP